MKRNTLGDWGEQVAAQYLAHKGYQVTERQYRTCWGEIDLIAQKGEFLVFVEVKLRKDAHFMQAVEAVTKRKQEKLRLTALMYQTEHDTEALQPRFDVIEVYAPFGKRTQFPRVVHWENAFW